MSATFHDLKNKHVLITGGAGGIGAAVSAAFAAQGSRVSILDHDAKAGEAITLQLRQSNPLVNFHPVDLTDFDRLAPLLHEIENDAGPVDCLINNGNCLPPPPHLFQRPA